MTLIAVTGGSGKAGRAVVQGLKQKGLDVRNIDQQRSNQPGDTPWDTHVTDLTDFGQTVDALESCDAIAHLAAIPAPGLKTDQETFRINTMSTYNVFRAAAVLGIKRVAWASSETVMGIPLNEHPPPFVPITEETPTDPRSSYALSKILGEQIGQYFYDTAGITSVALRLSNVIEPKEYANFATNEEHAQWRIFNLWAYIDTRDVAQAFHKALTADYSGAHVCLIAAADTAFTRPTADLMAEHFPGVEIRDLAFPRASTMSSAKAKALFGFEPEHSWMDGSVV